MVMTQLEMLGCHSCPDLSLVCLQSSHSRDHSCAKAKVRVGCHCRVETSACACMHAQHELPVRHSCKKRKRPKSYCAVAEARACGCSQNLRRHDLDLGCCYCQG